VDVVGRALAGERQAWAEIWDEHGLRLHAYARRLLSNPYDVDDVVADTFVTAAERLADLRDPAALRPWLYAICRRHVQRRWEARDKVRPVDEETLVRVVDSREEVVSRSGLDAAEATELLWAAAEGMGPADRELLALVLSSDLDSGDVARVTGQPANAVYVRVSRLKDGLGRAAGALLVARHHREDCDELDAVLRDWDGLYSTVWRKRIARHVDGCEVCGGSRERVAASLFSVAVLAPLVALPALKQRCLDGVGTPELEPVSFDAGWPETVAWEKERRRLAVPVLALLAVAGLVAGAVALKDAGGPGTTAAAVTATPTAPSATAPKPPALPRSGSPSASTAPLPVTTRAPQAQPSPRAPAPRGTTAPPAPGPTVALALSETAIQTACGDPTTSEATVTATGSGLRTVVAWNGTAPGSKELAGSGTATVGPYQSVTSPSGTDTVTVRATVTDDRGRSVTTSRTLTVSIAPC
jgi:RNA polymerase sigma factor (sigma-70 family)